MNNKRIAHVVGTGTIGEPLIGLLASFRKDIIGFSFTLLLRTEILSCRASLRLNGFSTPKITSNGFVASKNTVSRKFKGRLSAVGS